jgi:hypothetical protein
MIVCHKYKFIFIKTRKTAGTSVEIALSQFCGKDDIITTLAKEDEQMRIELGYRGPQNFRVPFKHHKLTAYTLTDWVKVLLKQRPNPHIRRHADATFARSYLGEEVWNTYFKFSFERNPFDKAISRYYFQTRDLESRPEINSYIQSNTEIMLSTWNKYTINDQIVMDFIGRYERLTDDLVEIAQKIGLPELVLPKAKGNFRENRQHYSEVINATTRNHIEKMCSREIEAFGYQWVDKNKN